MEADRWPQQHGQNGDHQDQDEDAMERLPGHRRSPALPIASSYPARCRQGEPRASSLGKFCTPSPNCANAQRSWAVIPWSNLHHRPSSPSLPQTGHKHSGRTSPPPAFIVVDRQHIRPRRPEIPALRRSRKRGTPSKWPVRFARSARLVNVHVACKIIESIGKPIGRHLRHGHRDRRQARDFLSPRHCRA